MGVLLFFAFLAGFVTILAPCIWPLLPIVLSASSGQGRQRPLGITFGVMTSFTIFTLSISYLEKFLHVDPNLFRLLAVIIIGALGVSMLFPFLGTLFENFINRILSPFQNKIENQGSGFSAGYATGFSIGLVWAPCAGPILATVATLAATQAVDTKVILVTLAYVTGLGIPLFFFAMAGSWCFTRMRRFNKYTGRVQQVFGLIMIIAAVLIYTNYDKVIQVKILNAFPAYGNIFNNIEHNERVTKELSALRGEETSAVEQTSTDKKPDFGPASEFAGIKQWLNSSPLTMAQLKGKVVLIDFWTYSCINCVRTLPYVTGWYDKYKDNNFVVIGVHTPEFAFEKETKNVEKAIKQFGIHYPVAQDNDFATWKAYKNRYWPAEYLIDAQGRIRLTHFGEGHYEEMEQSIRELLAEAGQTLKTKEDVLLDNTPKNKRTPETYLGLGRMERFSSNEDARTGEQTFTLPAKIPVDSFAYEGTWILDSESAHAEKNAALEFRFQAEKVFLVISPKIRGDQIAVFIDGKQVPDNMAGADLKNGVVTLDEERLYHLISLSQSEEHTLRLEFKNNGIAVYAFTFG
jgi:cytochrome c biogenesis protein CcdA/thiol-disulfide isomerase/thioredoxin